MKLKNELLVKPFYSVPQLARLIGYSSQGARKFLFKLNLPIHLVGNRYIVYLTDLQSYCPQLYNSILESQNINNLINKEVIEDNDTLLQEQFYRSEKDIYLDDQ
jgi:hypothetical protein